MAEKGAGANPAKGRRASPGKVKKTKEKLGRDRARPQRAKANITPGNLKVMLGEDDVTTWDDEELIRGRRRNAKGNFIGKDPAVIPREVYNETLRRSMRRADNKLRKMQEDALAQLESIISGQDVEDKDRLKAIEMVLHRTLGKVPDKIEVSVAPAPWEDLAVEAIVDVEVVGGEGDQ